MAKIDATRRSKRRSKVAPSETVEEKDKTEGQTESVSSSEQTVKADEDAPKDNRDEQDSQMDAVIEVKGNTSTVAVSWDKTNMEGEVDDTEKRANPSDHMMDSEEPAQIISTADAVGSTEDSPSESPETKMEQEMKESGESQVDVVAGSPATTVTWEKKNQEGESDHVKKESNRGKQKIVKKNPVKGKRTAGSTVETSPAKKPKLINDGYCLFVGNLNNSKAFDEVKDSLANYFMTQSLLVQDIRLDRSRKHAHVDLASEMDFTKGLMLNGEMLNDKPMKIAKAKVKKEEVKSQAEDKKVKDGRCLFLKNVPYSATKTDIKKIFPKAVSIRFPGGTEGPSTGIAFVEFKNRSILKKVRWRKREVKIQGRVVIVDGVGEKREKREKEKEKDTKASPNTTLFVSKLPLNMKEDNLQKLFEKAVSVSIPKRQGTSRGFAFVEFATVADAEKALEASKKMKISKRVVRVQFCKISEKSKFTKGPSKTLIVMGLAEKTTAETLKGAFEGSVSARVTMDKQTGVSKGFGFVEFESEDDSKAAKEAMDDCEIDGNKVTVDFARSEAKSPGLPAKLPVAADEPPAGGCKEKGARRKRKGKRGADTPQDTVKEVENKG